MEEKVFSSTRQVLEHYMPNYAAQQRCPQAKPAGPSVEGKGKEFAEGIFEGMKKDLRQPTAQKQKSIVRKLGKAFGSLFNSN